MVSLGAVCALIAVFFWMMVMPHGPTTLGVACTLLFSLLAVVLLLVGCVGAGVSVGRKD